MRVPAYDGGIARRDAIAILSRRYAPCATHVACGVTLAAMLERPRASRVQSALLLLGLLGCIPGFTFAKGAAPALAVGPDERAFAAEVARDGGPSEKKVLATLANLFFILNFFKLL